MTDFTPVYEEARRWASENRTHDYEVAIRFGAWFCGYYIERIANDDPSPDAAEGWKLFHAFFSDISVVVSFAPAHKHAYDWAYQQVDYADSEIAERFAAWFCGYYADEIANNDPSLCYPTCWERFLECFSDVAEEWGL